MYDNVTEYESLKQLMLSQDFSFKESTDAEGRIYALHVSWFDEAPNVDFIDWDTITCVICLGNVAYEAASNFVAVNPYIDNVFVI